MATYIVKNRYIFRRVNGKAKAVKDPRINQVVSLKLDLADQHRKLLEIAREMTREERATERAPLSGNVQLLEKYWAMNYVRRKSLPDSKRSAMNAFQRLLKTLGPVSIATDSIEKLQQAIDFGQEPNKQRRLCASLNTLLKFAMRQERAYPVPKYRPPVRHLTEEELLKITAPLSALHALVLQVAFASGARLGEIFALDIWRDGELYISRQMYSDGSYGPTKNRKRRWAQVLPRHHRILNLWAMVGEEERRELRRLRWADIVVAASEKHLNRRLVFHDLRHSYAINMLQNGKRLEDVSTWLGDSIVVAQEYYVGWEVRHKTPTP